MRPFCHELYTLYARLDECETRQGVIRNPLRRLIIDFGLELFHRICKSTTTEAPCYVGPMNFAIWVMMISRLSVHVLFCSLWDQVLPKVWFEKEYGDLWRVQRWILSLWGAYLLEMPRWVHRCLCYVGYRTQTHLQIRYWKFRPPLTYFAVAQSFRNFAQSTMSYSVQNLKTVLQLTRISLLDVISQDLSLRWVWDGFPVLSSVPDYHITGTSDERHVSNNRPFNPLFSSCWG